MTTPSLPTTYITSTEGTTSSVHLPNHHTTFSSSKQQRPLSKESYTVGWTSGLGRRPHKAKVVSSNLTPATSREGT